MNRRATGERACEPAAVPQQTNYELPATSYGRERSKRLRNLHCPFTLRYLSPTTLGGDNGQCASGGSRSPARDGVAGLRREEIVIATASRSPSRRRSLDGVQPS